MREMRVIFAFKGLCMTLGDGQQEKAEKLKR
jgi:hypothetical protein